MREKTPQLDLPNDRLRWLRERSGFATASDAARRFGRNENTYRSHENGERGLTRKAILKYARAYKASAEWLDYGQGSMTQFFEPELITLWENLSPEKRKDLIRYAKMLASEAA